MSLLDKKVTIFLNQNKYGDQNMSVTSSHMTQLQRVQNFAISYFRFETELFFIFFIFQFSAEGERRGKVYASKSEVLAGTRAVDSKRGPLRTKKGRH